MIIKNEINYSQCWEDPEVLLQALCIKPDDRVLSITSGGDNSLALLLVGAEKIDSIDLNPAQNYLLELKMKALSGLSYPEYLELLGVTDSKNRGKLFEKIKANLTKESRAWWAVHQDLIELGLINCGRFERFTLFFARRILPYIHSKQTIREFLSCQTLEEQRSFYEGRWNSLRWRWLFKFVSNRLVLRMFARQKSLFKHGDLRAVASIYMKRLEKHLRTVPLKGNFFLEYRLKGKYGRDLPPYLKAEGYDKLLVLLSATKNPIKIVKSDILSYLKDQEDETFSKYNLSDIFEGLSLAENTEVWKEIMRTAKPGAIVLYWNNLVPRTYPPQFSADFQTDEIRLTALRAQDRIFFYDRLYVHTIIK
ncbi:MAG: DUF3419 family protein [Candidatus Paceibacterota bacterium]